MSTAQPVAVVKVGGDVLLNPKERHGIAANIKDLVTHGWQVVILHGGGPQTNQLQHKLGLTPRKIAGRRVTSYEDLQVVKQAICGEVNVNLTQLLQGAGVNAFGCHGASGGLISAIKRPPCVISGGGSEAIDFGEVGDVVAVNTKLLKGLLSLDVIPVIATLGIASETTTGTKLGVGLGVGLGVESAASSPDEGAHVYNINADTTVVRIASALQADLLLLTTAVGAIYRDLADPNSRVGKVNMSQAQALIAQGVIQGGMIPKVEEALAALEQGVKNIAIVGPQQAGSFVAVSQGQSVKGTIISR